MVIFFSTLSFIHVLLDLMKHAIRLYSPWLAQNETQPFMVWRFFFKTPQIRLTSSSKDLPTFSLMVMQMIITSKRPLRRITFPLWPPIWSLPSSVCLSRQNAMRIQWRSMLAPVSRQCHLWINHLHLLLLTLSLTSRSQWDFKVIWFNVLMMRMTWTLMIMMVLMMVLQFIERHF